MKTKSGVICAGNWIVDIVHEIGQWPRENDLVRINGQDKDIGGGAANVISGLNKLETGIPLWPMGAIGDDEYGQFILARCAEMGLPSDLLHVKEGVATAHTHVMSVTGESRTFFYQGGANDVLSEEDFVAGVFRSLNAKVFYLGYLTLLSEMDRIESDGKSAAATVLGRARAAGMSTCVDLVSVDRPDFAESISTALPYIDYLILNEIEVARANGLTALANGKAIDQVELTEMAKSLIDAGVKQAVVVHCTKFALWVGSDGHALSVPVESLPREEIASPLGAGDAFCAGVLFAIHEGWSPQRALKLGHAVAKESLRGVTATEAIPNLQDLFGLRK